jgi:phosphoglycerate dehydrogenase-like enzyme
MSLTGKRIAVVGPSLCDYGLSDDELDSMHAAAPGAELIVCRDPVEFAKRLAHADVGAGQIGSVALPDLRRLVWFHSWSAGVDHEPVEALHTAGVTITCSKGNGAVPVAEFTLMAILMMTRRAEMWIEAQRRRAWERRITAEVKGSTLGVLGLGHIGQEIVRRASAFGMTCVGVRRDVTAPLPADIACKVLPSDRITEMLRVADFVVVAAPLTPSTRGMLREAHFRAMKRSAVYVCVSRGAIADPEALRRALVEGWIGGAFLDAHAVEPLPLDSAFWDLPHTIVTPHNAGATSGNAARAIAIFVDNLRLMSRGEPLRNRIEPHASY